MSELKLKFTDRDFDQDRGTNLRFQLDCDAISFIFDASEFTIVSLIFDKKAKWSDEYLIVDSKAWSKACNAKSIQVQLFPN